MAQMTKMAWFSIIGDYGDTTKQGPTGGGGVRASWAISDNKGGGFVFNSPPPSRRKAGVSCARHASRFGSRCGSASASSGVGRG